jgi:hypothetical protein
VEGEAPISRSELEAMLFSIHDIRANMEELVALVKGDEGGEEDE